VSKFEELCRAREESTRQFISYRDESWKFAQRLMGSLGSYLGCSPENICFVATQERIKPTHIQLAMQFTNDGFWQFGLVLGLQNGAPAPAQGYYLQFAIKRQGSSFKVKLLQIEADNKIIAENPFMVARDNPDFREVSDFIFEKIKSYFDPDLDKVLGQMANGKPIGFLGNLES
jgi:hypothetical protein